MHTVLVTKIIYRDKSEFGEDRKISKFYRALVTGILDNDEVVVTQPIGLVHYPGVAERLYAACSSGSLQFHSCNLELVKVFEYRTITVLFMV